MDLVPVMVILFTHPRPVIATCLPTAGIVEWSVNPAHAGFGSVWVTV